MNIFCTWIFRMLAIGSLISPFFAQARWCYSSDDGIWGTYHLGAEFAAGRFIALDQAYGGISYFAVPNHAFRSVYFLLDASAYKLENNNSAASIGLGLRAWDESQEKAYGFNFFYDYRYAYANPFNQVGIGFEILSSDWEFHLNGYLPVGGKSHSISKHQQVLPQGVPAISRKHGVALQGVELTGGARFWLDNQFTAYVASGFYFYNNKNIGDIQGIQCSCDIGWQDWINFRLNASYDSRFRGRVQGVFYLTLPLESICGEVCECCRLLILDRPVQRNDMIFLKDCHGVERKLR